MLLKKHRQRETWYEAKYGAVVCDLKDHMQILGRSLSNTSNCHYYYCYYCEVICEMFHILNCGFEIK